MNEGITVKPYSQISRFLPEETNKKFYGAAEFTEKQEIFFRRWERIKRDIH